MKLVMWSYLDDRFSVRLFYWHEIRLVLPAPGDGSHLLGDLDGLASIVCALIYVTVIFLFNITF